MTFVKLEETDGGKMNAYLHGLLKKNNPEFASVYVPREKIEEILKIGFHRLDRSKISGLEKALKLFKNFVLTGESGGAAMTLPMEKAAEIQLAREKYRFHVEKMADIAQVCSAKPDGFFEGDMVSPKMKDEDDG